MRPPCALGPVRFVAVNVEKSSRGRWFKAPHRSDWHPRGILGGAVLGWAAHRVQDGAVEAEQSCPSQPRGVDTARRGAQRR